MFSMHDPLKNIFTDLVEMFEEGNAPSGPAVPGFKYSNQGEF